MFYKLILLGLVVRPDLEIILYRNNWNTGCEKWFKVLKANDPHHTTNLC